MKFDLNAQVESRLPLRPDNRTFNMALCTIESIDVKGYEIPLILEDGKENENEYKGLTVPRINILFKSVKLKDEDPDRFYTFSEGPIVSIKNDGSPQSPKDLIGIYKGLYDKLKHIHNAFVKQENYKPIASLPDIDESASAKIRAEQFSKFFNTFAESFNIGKDNTTPIYHKGGNSIPVLLKLVADDKGTKFVTPKYVSQGWIEVAEFENNILKTPKVIEVKVNDRIELKPTSQGKKDNTSTNQLEEDDEAKAILKQYGY